MREFASRHQTLDTKLCRHGLLKPQANPDDYESGEHFGRANRSCQDSSQFKRSFDQGELGFQTQPSENTAAFLRNLEKTEGGTEQLRKPTIIPSQLTIGSVEQPSPSISAFHASKSLVASVQSREKTR